MRPAELCPEFSTQWHLGGAGGLLPPLPSVDGGFLSSELVGEAEDRGLPGTGSATRQAPTLRQA